jgi:hypothetical protein
MVEMIRVSPGNIDERPILEFPFQKPPSLWVPEKTVLRLDHGKRVPLFTWMYLDRSAAGSTHLYNPASLSTVRLDAIPQAIRRLSDYFRLKDTSSKTIYGVLASFGRFLAWIDNDEHDGLFEGILSDPDSVPQAHELYYRYLKGRIQSHTLHRRTCVNQHNNTLKVLSIIHDRQYGDEIEKISSGVAGTTKAPKSEDVAQFMSTLTTIFDSACRILESHVDTYNDERWELSISTDGDHQIVSLPKGYSRARLMELAAMSFTGLVIADSGANLAQVQIFEEPQDFLEQLAEPDRVSLTQKVVKLRAGGKAVPLTMTAVTFTRLRRFANIRHQIIELLGCDDIAPFFFKCEYARVQNGACESRSRVGLMEPLTVIPISDYFAVELRKKVSAAGAKLPRVTLRQLRTHKQQHLVRHHGLKVAADAMGTPSQQPSRHTARPRKGFRPAIWGGSCHHFTRQWLAALIVSRTRWFRCPPARVHLTGTPIHPIRCLPCSQTAKRRKAASSAKTFAFTRITRIYTSYCLAGRCFSRLGICRANLSKWIACMTRF